MVFANLFADTDEAGAARSDSCNAQRSTLVGIESGINTIRPTGEQRDFADHHPLRKATG